MILWNQFFCLRASSLAVEPQRSASSLGTGSKLTLELAWWEGGVKVRVCVCPYTPGHRVGVEEVSEQPGHIPQLVGLQAVNGVVLLGENRLKTLHVLFLQQAEPLNTHTR